MLDDESDQYRIDRFGCPGDQFISGLARKLEGPVADFFRGGILQYASDQEHSDALLALEQVVQRLHNQAPPLHTPLILARAVALAMDLTVLADSRMEQFKLYYTAAPTDSTRNGLRPVRPRDPVPTCFGVFGAVTPPNEGQTSPKRATHPRHPSFGTNPQNLPAWRRPDRLPSVVLAPAVVEQFELFLDFQLESELTELHNGPLSIATFHPTKSLEGDVKFWLDDQHHERFFWVHARCQDEKSPSPVIAAYKDRGDLVGRITDAMEQAANEGARLLMLPELVLAKEDVDAIFKAWREIIGRHQEPLKRPILMLPGTWHGEADRRRTNESELWGIGQSGMGFGTPTRPSDGHIYKVVPYAHRLRPDYVAALGYSDEFQHHIVEDIHQPEKPELVLFCCEDATMMVLICVDFLLDELRDLTRDLYVSLILIPSMSDKVRVFQELMVGHVAATEAVIVFANTLRPSDGGTRHPVALVQHPDQRRISQVDEKSASGLATGPGAAVIKSQNPKSTRVKWLPL